jgi:hypothetical protein
MQALRHIEKTVNVMVGLGHSHFSEIMKYYPKDYSS